MGAGTMEAGFRRLVGVDTDHVTLRHRAARLLRRYLGYDFAVWATIDPTTLMWTHCIFDGGERDLALESAVFRNEYHEPDVLKLSELMHVRGHAGTLQHATNFDPASSTRYRETLQPAGFTDELRVLFTDGGDAWGALCVMRSGGVFTEQELAPVAAVGASFGQSLRGSLLRTATDTASGLTSPPGLIVCGPGGSIEAVSDEAAVLLGTTDADDVRSAIASTVTSRAAGGPGTAMLPTRLGGWIGLHATYVGSQAAVVVEQLRPNQLAELIVRLRGLTPRERDIVGCVARGLSTKAIGAALFISDYTVQDHLKAIFAKFGVASRAELVAAVFFDHYRPRHDRRDDPSPYGWFLDRPAAAT